MSSATYYAWRAKYGGLEVSDAKRLGALEEENGRLKRLLADTMLDDAGLKDLLSKNGRQGGSHEHAVSLVPSGRWRPAVEVRLADTVRALMKLEAAHVFGGRGVGRAPEERRERANVTDVVMLGSRPHHAHRYVVEHPLT